jgi:Ca2+-transporting ATPase
MPEATPSAGGASASPRYLHALPGRLRADVAGLRGDPAFARRAERALRAQPGVLEAEANPLTGRMLVRYDARATDQAAILDVIGGLERRRAAAHRRAARRREGRHPPRTRPPEDPLSMLVRAVTPVAAWATVAGLSLKVLVSGFGRRHRSEPLHAVSVSLGVAAGYPQLAGTLRWRVGGRSLIGQALDWTSLAVKAYRESILGLAADGAGHLLSYLEHSALRHNRRRLRRVAPGHGTARLVLSGGRAIEIPSSELQPGETIRIDAGERVPADGEVLDGTGLVDERGLTGAAFFSPKGPGDPVFFGSRLEQGQLTVRLVATGRETRLAREYRQAVLPAHPALPAAITRAIRQMGLGGLVLAAATALLTWSWRRVLAVLAILNPTAVAQSALAAGGAATEAAHREGIRIQRRGTFLALAGVDVIVFVEPGALTQDSAAVRDVIPLYGARRDDVLALAAAAVYRSPFPAGPPLLERALEARLNLPPASGIRLLGGRAVRALIDGAEVVVGDRDALAHRGIATEAADRIAGPLRVRCSAVLVVARGGAAIGVIGIQRVPGPHAAPAVRELHTLGLEVALVTAGPAESVDEMVRTLGPVRVYAEAGPRERRALVRSLERRGRRVAVVAASASDLPALGHAAAAIAVEDPGPPALSRAADVLLPPGRLDLLPGLIRLSRAVRRTYRQNTQAALVVSALGAWGAVAGLISFGLAGDINHYLTLGLLWNSRRLSVFQFRVPRPRRGAARAAEPPWHALPVSEVARALGSESEAGLAPDEAARRLQRVGRNLLEESRPPTFLLLFARQLATGMTALLAVAAAGSAVAGEPLSAALIGAVVLLNAALGGWQEHRAERAVAALRAYVAPTARVIRGGLVRRIPAAQIVPGDVIELGAGESVPADARILESHGCEVEESLLTGESLPVEKQAAPVPPRTPLAERTSMVYLGTVVTRGRATVIVTATGMRTAAGRIAGLLSQDHDDRGRGFQARLVEVTRNLAGLSVLGGIVFLGAGLLRGIPTGSLIMGAVSLVTAAVPEGLPTIVSIAFGAAVQRMSREALIVRRLSAIETLSRVTVICSDKTGTLTLGRMAVRAIIAGGQPWRGDTVTPEAAAGDRRRVLVIGAVCNDAAIVDRRTGAAVGGATESALTVAAAQAGLDPVALRERYERVAELPFSEDRSYMAVACRSCRSPDGALVVFVKGAPETVLQRCTRRLVDGREADLDAAGRADILAASDRLAYESMRVLGTAYAPIAAVPGEAALLQSEGWVFAGLVGMSDPLRPEVRQALAKCVEAGIRVVIVTGDHRSTAIAIGRQLGLAFGPEAVVDGQGLERRTDAELRTMIRLVRVFARVTPEQKVRIVSALKESGDVVAMTGDGVNDAPAVKRADVGFAMGRSGTEVTRQAASIVLGDDSFASIVRAVEEARGVHRNLRRALGFLIGGNLGETLFILTATLLAGEMPLLPLHLLLVNLFTDALPVMALAALPPPAGALRERPRRDLFDAAFRRAVWGRGVVTGLAASAAYAFVLPAPLPRRRATALAGLVASQLVQAQGWSGAGRSDACFKASLGVSWAALLAVMSLGPFRTLFGTGPLTALEWGRLIGISFAADWAVGRLSNPPAPLALTRPAPGYGVECGGDPGMG